MASVNPFRYRGYYYDTETGFYYLQSRYYDPAIGRFINADNLISGVNGNLQGYNLYAYCFNNPINIEDENGNWPQWIKNSFKWVAKNIVKPIVKSVQENLSKVDATYSTGVNISGTPSIFNFNIQAGVSIDTQGNVALQYSTGGGFTTGSPSLSVTGYKSVTNAPSIYELEGMGYQIGGSIGVPIYGVSLALGADLNVLEVKDKTCIGMTTNAGFGTPGAEFHVEWGKTGTVPGTQFNIFDVAEDIYIKIMEW